MNERIKTLSDEAAKLAPQDRAELVETILQSLDVVNPALDALWAKEAHDRYRAYRAGEIGSVDFDAALAALERK